LPQVALWTIDATTTATSVALAFGEVLEGTCEFPYGTHKYDVDQCSTVGDMSPSRPEPPQSIEQTMTPAEFYRGEAVRCRDRAERSSTSERAAKWQARAKEYERLARELEGEIVKSVSP